MRAVTYAVNKGTVNRTAVYAWASRKKVSQASVPRSTGQIGNPLLLPRPDSRTLAVGQPGRRGP